MALTLAEIGLWITTGVMVLLVAAFVALGSGWGSGIIHRVLELVNADFLGRVEVGSARVFPDGTAILTNVRILDPEGRVIIEADRATAHTDLPRLIRKELHLTFASAEGVRAGFAIDEAGDVNIARAFLPRHPQPPSPPGQAPGGGFAVVIDDVSVGLERAALTVAPIPQPVAQILNAHVTGRVELTPAGDVIIQPEMTGGTFRGPLAGEVAVAGRMTLVGSTLTAVAVASLGDSSLQASAQLDLDHLSGFADADSLILGPRTLSLWLGAQKPRGARATLAARFEGGAVRLDHFELQPLEGPGKITAAGLLSFESGDGEARISGRHVDGRALFGSLPVSDVSFDLKGAFSALFEETRSATAHFQMGAWRWDGQLVGPGQLDAQAQQNRLRVTNLDLAVPGARVIGQADLSDRSIKGRVTVEAGDLGRTRSAVESIARVDLPDVGGQATIHASVDGPFRDLALQADVRSNHASLNGLRAHDLVAKIQAPRIGSHMDLQAHLLLGQLQIGEETLSQIDLTLGWKTPELSLLARLSNRGQSASVWSRLIVPANFQRGDLEELVLTLPDGEWRLQLPAHFDFENGVSFKDFHLASGPQGLWLSLQAAPERLQLAAEVENLDLSRIPAVVFQGRSAAGVIDASLHYQQNHHHRSAQAEIAASALAIDRLHIPNASIEASLDDAHLAASLEATVGSGKARGHFEGPLPLRGGRLDGRLEISGLEASDFATYLPQLKPFSGALTLDLGLAGSWASPSLQLDASGEQLKGPWIGSPGTGLGPLAVELHLSTSEGFCRLQGTIIDHLQPTIDLLDLNGTFGVGSRQLAELLRKPGELPARLSDAPLRLDVKTSSIPLPAVARLVPQISTARGTAQLEGHVTGSAHAPRGDLQVALSNFGFPHRHIGAIDLHAEAAETGLTLRGSLTPPAEAGGHATFAASWGLRPEDLAHASLRRGAPLRASLEASDLPLALVLGRRSDLQGLATATAELHGSLAEPSFKARLSFTSLRVLDKPAGEIDASADWNGRLLMAKLTGDQPTGGKVSAQADLPFGAAGLGTGPLTGHLAATSFDLSVFEPVLVQTGTVRALGGVLNADLALGGTRDAPEPSGTLSLTQGRLALAGFGELQHMLVSLHLDQNSLVIDRLDASSGGGPLTAHLSAVRTGKQQLTLSGQLENKHFGIYADDQLRALLTSQADINGKLTLPGPGADVSISVHSASVRIPTLTQRELAPATLDPDIHILSWKAAATDEYSSSPESSRPPSPIYLRLSAPGPLEVTGPDVRLTARAKLAVRIASDAELTGLVAVEKGEVNALGRTFRIYRANVAFGDEHGDFAPPSSGRLDVEAGQEIDGYRVTMVVLGRLDHPVPQLSSDPPLPQSQISQMLASGSSEGSVGSQSQTGGSSIASNLLVEGMKTWLKINPPVDVLTVDPSRLEAGKRITRHLYIGVTDNYAAVNDPRINGTEVHARYDLGHHFALDSRYGTSQAGSFDLQWRHNW